MATAARVSEREYQELLLGDDDHLWELWDGVLVEKPPMTIGHTDVASYLGHLLQSQLDHRWFRVHINGARLLLPTRSIYIPDVAVVPANLVLPHKRDPHGFRAYADPLPLVVEVWSPTTGNYDVEIKLKGYRERGDQEIWFIHPYERTLTAGRRQPDGSYAEDVYTGGTVPIFLLPQVSIDLDALLDS